MGEGMALALGRAGLAVGAGVVWALARLAGRLGALEAASAAPEAAVGVLQREIQSVRGEARQAQEQTLQSVRQEMVQFGGQVTQQLGQLQSTVAGQLQAV